MCRRHHIPLGLDWRCLNSTELYCKLASEVVPGTFYPIASESWMYHIKPSSFYHFRPHQKPAAHSNELVFVLAGILNGDLHFQIQWIFIKQLFCSRNNLSWSPLETHSQQTNNGTIVTARWWIMMAKWDVSFPSVTCASKIITPVPDFPRPFKLL